MLIGIILKELYFGQVQEGRNLSNRVDYQQWKVKFIVITTNKYYITIFKILYQQMQKQLTFGGDSPQARFGHTFTPIGKQKAILFGGAVGDITKTSDKYIISGDTLLCDYLQRKFKKLQPRGLVPTNRAAHAAVFVQQFIFIFGGALGGGQLADDYLYQLDVISISDKAYWSVKNCIGGSPGARYGHVMGYLKPFVIIHGGNTGNQPVGDVWVNDVIGNAEWKKIDIGHQNPPPRAYHSASICKTGTANGMMVIFGGRGCDGQPLNDTWGLRKHRDNKLDWMKAPYRSNINKPAERYQHRTLFIGTLLLVIGGRNNNVGQCVTLDVYDTQTSDWYKLGKIDRFRHICFLIDEYIYIQGGFNQQTPTIPTDAMIQINLNKAFGQHINLYKGLAFQLGRVIITHKPNQIRRNSRDLDNNYPQQVQKKQLEQQLEKSNKRSIPLINKSIKLSSQALVANYQEQNDVKKICIDQLQSEHRKIKISSKQSFSRDTSTEKLYQIFSNILYCKSNPQLTVSGYSNEYLDKLMIKVSKIFDEETTLLRIRSPVKIFGDLHGQISELNRLFDAFGSPDDGPKGDIQSTNYLFLGDYIDRGSKSIQTLILLFTLKIKYPQNIFLLRGSHQDVKVNRCMGFADQCQVKFQEDVDSSASFFQKVNRVFERMPLVALINSSILCMHGGIGTSLSNISQIQAIQRPITINHDPKTQTQKIVYDILWSDPCRGKQLGGVINTEHDYFKNKTNLKFSEKRAYAFCSQNQLLTIIRSNEPVTDGFEICESLITVFSCSDYGGCGNKAAIIQVMKNEQISPMVLHPQTPTRDRWLQGLDRKKSSSQQQNQLRSLAFTPPK